MARIVGEKRRQLFAFGFVLCGLIFPGVACTQQPLLSPLSAPRPGLCLFPQACYQKECKCEDGPGACRVLGKTDAGGPLVLPGDPLVTDPAVACPELGDAGAGQPVECLLPEQRCVATGVACTGLCVRRGGRCGESGSFVPQRRAADGGGGQTFCPYGNDICCPAPDGGGAASDGGALDAAAGDGPMSMPDL